MGLCQKHAVVVCSFQPVKKSGADSRHAGEATPLYMYVIARGPAMYSLLSSVMRKPTDVINSSIFRFSVQPPAMCFQVGVRRSCQRATLDSGARPCSRNISWPSGLSTRLISRKARDGSAIEHKTQVITTVSRLAAANVAVSSADWHIRMTLKGTLFARLRALARSSGEQSRPRTRKM